MKHTLIPVILLAVHLMAEEPVHLLRAATVQADIVLLSDLLSHNAPASLQSKALKISLGRAPEVGSFRVLVPDEIRKVIPDDSEFGVPKQIVVQHAGWRLDRDRVARTLAKYAEDRGFDLKSARIDTPSEFATRRPDPQFDVVRIMEDRVHQVAVAEMRCHDRSACGHFLTRVFFPEWRSESKMSRKQFGSYSPEAARGASTRKFVPVSGPALVVPGRPALLMIEEDGLKITEPVQAQRRAGLGELVRVRDGAGHRWLLAEVVGEGLLRPVKPGQAGGLR